MQIKKLPGREKRMVALFKKISSLYNLAITKQEVLQNKIIGLDKKNKRILVVESDKKKCYSKFIDLHELKTCKIKKIYQAIFANNFRQNTLEDHLSSISLEFNFKSTSKPCSLEFYKNTSHKTHLLSGVEHKANVWKATLLQMLPETQSLSIQKQVKATG